MNKSYIGEPIPCTPDITEWTPVHHKDLETIRELLIQAFKGSTMDWQHVSIDSCISVCIDKSLNRDGIIEREREYRRVAKNILDMDLKAKLSEV